MSDRERLADPLTHSVIGAFFEVYRTLGFGFLEHLYVMAIERELRARGHRVGREVSIPVWYKGDHLGTQRLDLIVDDVLVIEIKSTLDLPRTAERQVYNYLSATNLRVGLLLHFGPEPKVYRIESRRPRATKEEKVLPPSHPTHPSHPVPPLGPGGQP